MLEVIGAIAVACILFVIIRGFIRGGAAGHMGRVCGYAVELGVPLSFAQDVVSDTALLNAARSELKRENSEFGMLDVYIQNGLAIEHLFKRSAVKAHEAPETNIIEGLKDLIQPQISSLKQVNQIAVIDDSIYAYVGVLATSISGKAMNIGEIKDLLVQILPGEDYRFGIDNGYAICSMSSNFVDKCGQILPRVQTEIESGRGEFLEKYSLKARELEEQMFSGDFDADSFDPSTVDDKAWLDVD